MRLAPIVQNDDSMDFEQLEIALFTLVFIGKPSLFSKLFFSKQSQSKPIRM